MDNFIKIIQALYIRTQLREINWEQTNLQNQFVVKLGEGHIVVQNYDEIDIAQSYGELPIYIVKFENRNGDSIGFLEASSVNSENYELLNNLWIEINDSFYRKKETIRSMLDDLGLD